MHGKLGFIGSLTLLVCTLTGCQIIPPEDRLVPIEEGHSRPALLIEFTGINCVNCPQAEEVATQLEGSMSRQGLVVVSMHPASNPFTQAAAPYDYTCPEADTYYLYCGGTAQTPFPTGSINLKANDDGSFFIDYMQWGKTLTALHTLPLLGTTHEQRSNEIDIHVQSFEQTPDTVNLITWIVEDSVQGPQRLADGSLSTQYYHRHMLRKALSPIWGDTVTLEPFETQTIAYTLPDMERTHNSIVSALWHKQEIIYVYQTPIQ